MQRTRKFGFAYAKIQMSVEAGQGMAKGFIAELRRRNVLRAVVLYAGAVWALAQGIAQLGPEIGAPDGSTRWFLMASAIGFPLWIAFSWFFELTSEGLKLESEITPEARSNQSHRKIDLAIIAVLVVAVVLLVTDRVVDPPVTAVAKVAALPTDKSIAVLPLDNVSGDKGQQYFSDGLSESLIIALSRINGLRVINRKSSFQFRDHQEDSHAIAAKLGVSHLLEGSVRHNGDVVRISASLIRAADGSTVWADQFDRPYKDLFALQDQIVAKVAAALKSELLPTAKAKLLGDRPPSGNLEAYNAYLQARAATNLEDAISGYDAAIKLDPGYALAYAMKGRTLVDTAQAGVTGEVAKRLFNQAEEAVSKARTLAPEHPATLVAYGDLLMVRDFDWHGAELALRRAVKLAPDDGDALYMLGVVRASQGDLAQAVKLTQHALELDPMNANWYRWLVAYLLPLNKFDEANAALAKAIELEPKGIYNHHLQTILEVLRKRPDAAQKAAMAEPQVEWRDFALAMAAQIGPDRAKADALLQQCVQHYAEGWSFQIAQLYALRGEPDAMFEWLQRALDAHDPGMQSLLYDALLLRYRDDPRYRALATKASLPWPFKDAAKAAAEQ